MSWKKKLGNVLTLCSITACVVFCVMAAYADELRPPGIESEPETVAMTTEAITEAITEVETEAETVEVAEAPETVPEAVVETVAETEPVYDATPLKNRKPSTVTLYDIPLSDDLQIYITRLCSEYHIDRELIFAMIERESTYNPNAMGDNGRSYGLMQIQLRYVRERMDKLGCTDLLDPYDNVTVGIDLIAEYIDKGYGLEWALMAYNGGEGYAYSMRANGYVSNYARSVIANAEAMKGGEQ